MNKLVLFLSIILVFSISACQKENATIQIKPDSFIELKGVKNILNYKGAPRHSFDKNMLMFSDQGAWFAYSFPDSISYQGGFAGPFLMTQENGVWISPVLAQLKLVGINWSIQSTEAFHSHLEQIYSNSELDLKQELIFSSEHTAHIRSIITNKSSSKIEIEYYWQNHEILANQLTLAVNKNKLIISSEKSDAVGHLIFPKRTNIKLNKNLYATNNEKIVLDPGDSEVINITQSFVFPEYDWKLEMNEIVNSNFDSILNFRKEEKNSQIVSLYNGKRKRFKEDIYSHVLAKAHLTLQNNWRSPAGELKHEGLFPSYHYTWFHGFWSWDSWKHAVGLSYYDLKLAKNQMRAMYDFQSDDGFIVDCVYRDTTIEAHNYRDTKPPLSAWAVHAIYEKSKDVEFVKEFYPKLKRYHEWWYTKRDHDKDGICEYGSTDGTVLAAKWESGMDNAIRFDHSKILKNADGAYSLNQESVDLNAYLYAEKGYLLILAEALDLDSDVEKYRLEASHLKDQIQKQFYDESDGWFYDTNIEGTEFVKGEGSEGWIALWAKAASDKQALSVKNRMMNPEKFFTKVPFQTMSADHPKFDPKNGYWRGPNWLDQSYFGVKGLRNYGFDEEADIATEKILHGCFGLLEKGESIRENYHPLTGQGGEAQNFSWSAAHIIMLLMDE